MNCGTITGTFIDEITYDIPASNWSADEWKQDLKNMKDIGIDTVIFIRGGFGDRTIYPSKVFNTLGTFDLADLILREASELGMKVIFGLYITNLSWNKGDVEGEVRKNRAFMDEAWQRYGHYPSFWGWYIPHETNYDYYHVSDVMRELSAMCKDKTPDKKVMISPFFRSRITNPDTFYTPEEQYNEWHRIFEKCGKDIDICAFQDGTAPADMMIEYYSYINKLCGEYNISHWVNAETFERDVRRMYYPIPFEILKKRLELHKQYSDKIITFEFSHFLSPQSIYPSAKNLNNLYKQYYFGQGEKNG